MSMGVNLLFKLTEMVSNILKDNFDIEIVESHHNRKKDAPSGTAMKLAEIIAETLNRDVKRMLFMVEVDLLEKEKGMK